MERRVRFDFEIDFVNGGGLQGQDFRLDIEGEDIADAALADYIVRDLRLLMAGEVRILRKAIIAEPHKRRQRLVDLSHVIEDGMVTYPGLPGPTIRDHVSRADSRVSYAPGTEFQIGRIDMVANTGTYVDTPFHRFAEGADLAGLDLARVADLPGVVADATARPGRAVDAARLAAALAGRDPRGLALLVHTGWASRWGGRAYFTGHPFLTAEAASFLAEAKVALVGIDSLNIDDTGDPRRPAHTTLLAAGIPIVEHLCGLGALPASGFRVSAVPPKVAGMGTFPVRAYALIG